MEATILACLLLAANLAVSVALTLLLWTWWVNNRWIYYSPQIYIAFIPIILCIVGWLTCFMFIYKEFTE